jgi:hypothetical protein
MVLLMIACLIQAPSLDDRIDAFLKGDAAARGELMKLGASAIRPLLKARDKGPDKIDALVLELKKGVAYPPDSKLPRHLEGNVKIPATTITLSDDPEYAPIQWGDARRGIEAAIVVLPFKAAELKSTTADVRASDRPAREILDQLCRQTGLDYGYFHNAVVIGPPERLWAANAFGAAFATIQKLDPVDTAHMKVLGAETIPKLLQMGMNVRGLADFVRDMKRLDFTIKSGGDTVIPSIDAENIRTLDALSLITQAAGVDFAISAGTIVIDTRGALEKAK